jgi:microsomal dipeptidase-like Zn-dependent dipeptidase
MFFIAEMFLAIVFLLAIVVASAKYTFVPAIARILNRTRVKNPPPISPEAQALHQKLLIVDLHCDALLWNRDLLKRGTHGHVDLPRLQQGSVALQVFASVTQVPLGLNFERNAAKRDLVTLLATLGGWPPNTRTSRLRRALYMADKLHRYAKESHGQLMLIKSVTDLDELVARRKVDPRIVGALLALEGVHALEGRLENLDTLYDAGFRMIGLHHFFDNEAGGSAHGIERGGLTQFGRELVQRIQLKKMALDLAHSSPPVIADALAISTAPAFVSHTGLCGTANNSRNLTDAQARAIAATGGVMGIALFEHAVGGMTVDDTVRAVRYGADLVGTDHIALGSDWDGAIATPIDAAHIDQVTESLMRHGFSEPEIAQIMGGNALRVLKQILN